MACYTFKSRWPCLAHPREDGPIKLMNGGRGREREGQRQTVSHTVIRITPVREVETGMPFEIREFVK